MNCNVARDLLAGYNDDVLEEQTKAELEEHLSECEECSKINENMKSKIKTDDKNLKDGENIKPFKKIKKKLKHRKVTIILLSAFILMIAAGLVYLTVGQILRKDGIYSFELIGENFVGRKLGKAFERGDTDEIIKYLYFGNADNYTGIYGMDCNKTKMDQGFFGADGQKNLYDALCENFKNAYKKDFEGKKIKYKYSQCFYSDAYYDSESTPVISLCFEIDGNFDTLHIVKEDGKYLFYLYDNYGKYDYPELGKFYEIMSEIYYDNFILLAGNVDASDNTKAYENGCFEKLLRYYMTNNPDELKLIEKKQEKFNEDGTKINRIYNTTRAYDDVKKTIYTILCFEITDGKTGKKAIYSVRFNICDLENNKKGFDFDFEELINEGVRTEKIQELKDIYTIS